jgi:hypothetical protein
MLSETVCLPRFRESRDYGYEVKYGPNKLEATIALREGSKPIEILTGPKNVANVFLQAQKKINASPQHKLIISVWVVMPFIIDPNLDTPSMLDAHRLSFIRMHRVLLRLIRRKANKFFEDRTNGR